MSGGRVSEEAQTFLDSGTRFEGRILVTGVVRLDGHFKGDGKAQGTLIVGQNGVVEAQLDVERMVIHGTFNGSVRASERIEVGPTGRVQGTVTTPRLHVHEGAQLTTQIQMSDTSAAKPATSTTTTAAPAAGPTGEKSSIKLR